MFANITVRYSSKISRLKKCKHVTLSLANKLNMLERLDKGESLQKIASELEVDIATVKDWRKNRK